MEADPSSRPVRPVPRRRAGRHGAWALAATLLLAIALLLVAERGTALHDAGLLAAGAWLGAFAVHGVSRLRRRVGPDPAEVAAPRGGERLRHLEDEMRTPLATLRAGVELAESTATSDEQLEYLQAVRSSASRLQALVEDVVAGTGADATPEVRAFSLHTLLGDVAHELAPVARREELELLCDLAPAVPDGVRGDERALREVLRRLLEQAIRRSGEGSVRIGVFRESDEGARLRFRISATGPTPDAQGVPKTAPAAGWERSRAIALRMAQRLGTHVEERSGSGIDFEFAVELPEDARGRALFPADESLAGLRVLVVEPQPESRRLLGEQLLALGMRPVLMEEARAAHDTMHRATQERQPFALVILDPATRGSGVFRARRAGDDTLVASTPQVLLWAPPRADGEGFAGPPRLLRPVLPAELAAAVRRALVPRHRTERRRPRPSPAAAALRVLVVEHSALNALLTARMVGLLGHQAEVVRSGREALEVLESSPADVVLMDVQMPEPDGLEATRRRRALEAREALPRTPILGLNTSGQPEDQAACLQAGMDGNLLKPFDTRALRQAIDRVAPPEADRREPARPDPREALDVPRLRQRLGGDPEAAADVLGQFLEQCPAMLDRVREAVATGDAAALEQSAHRLKGTLLWIAADDAAATAGALEELGRRAELSAAGETLDSLETRAGAVLAEIPLARESLMRPGAGRSDSGTE